MDEKTVLPINKMDADQLRIQLESAHGAELREARQRAADLLWEAVHCPADLTWLQPRAVG